MNMDQNLSPALNSDKAPPRRTTFGEIEEIEDDVTRQFNRFKSFDVVSSRPSDHHYYDLMEYVKLKFRKRMEEEWNRLRDLIPSSIFVRTYTPRVDLMRAAFICPSGHDFEHSLFFFDIYFPADYPSVPPKVHYLSYGIEWNPNLRSDGRVYLDILGTKNNFLKQIISWSNNREKWNPDQSNILHVLYAIQNLISHNSSPGKHNTGNFASACEKMTRVLRRPPAGFEYFVAGHFRQRAHPILLKFKDNNYQDEIMIDLFIRMFTVFERNGAYCKHHLDLLKSRKLQITLGEEIWQIKDLLMVINNG